MLRDEIIEQTKSLKDRSAKEKLEYFWTYYRWHVIVIILAVIFIVGFVKNVIKAPSVGFMTAFINTESYGDQKALQNEASEALGFDPKEVSVAYNTDIYLGNNLSSGTAGANSLTTLLYAKDLDIMVCDSTGLKWINDSRVMAPLSTYLSEDFLTKYADYVVSYTDEETGETFPAFLTVPDTSRVYSFGLYPEEVKGKLFVSIACTTQRGEHIEQYLTYLLSPSDPQ